MRTFSTCTHTALFLEGTLFSLCPEAAQAHPGLLHMTFPKQFSQHKLRPQGRHISVQGRLRLFFVTRDCEHHEAASPLMSKEHRQASSLHIPPEQLQKPSSATTIFCHLSVQPIPYKGLVEYCWMSCWWQGLQTRWGLILDGRGSSFTEQASQKMPLQFLQMFFFLLRLLSSRQSWQISAFPGPESCSCSSCVLLGNLCVRTLFSLGGCFSLAFSSWILSFPSCLTQFFVPFLFSWLRW